jgi:hypothetical protein
MYATNAKLDAEMQKREEDNKKLLESDIHKWFLLMNKMKCYYDNWKESVRIDGVRYSYIYPRKPSDTVKIALIKYALSRYSFMDELIELSKGDDIFLKFIDEIKLIKNNQLKNIDDINYNVFDKS